MKKLHLKDLTVKSYVTTLEVREIKGGRLEAAEGTHYEHCKSHYGDCEPWIAE